MGACMTGWLWKIAAVLIGAMPGLVLLTAVTVSAAPGQLAIAYGVDPAQPVVGLPVTVTASVSAIGGPLNVALVHLFPVTATMDGTRQTITATVTAAPNGPPTTYIGTLTFPAPGTWHITSPNWQAAPGNDFVVSVGDLSLGGVAACHAADLASAAQWEP